MRNPPAIRSTLVITHRRRRSSPSLARARLTVRAPITKVMPRPKNRKMVTPETNPDRVSVLDTRPTNTAIPHEMLAIAYDTPKRKSEPIERFLPPLSRRGVDHGTCQPDTMAMPTPISSTPIPIVGHFAYLAIVDGLALNTTPTRRNTERKPRAMTAMTLIARATPSAVVRLSVPSSVPRKNDKYAGNMTNPHGFTVATIPVVNASANLPSIIRMLW